MKNELEKLCVAIHEASNPKEHLAAKIVCRLAEMAEIPEQRIKYRTVLSESVYKYDHRSRHLGIKLKMPEDQVIVHPANLL